MSLPLSRHQTEGKRDTTDANKLPISMHRLICIIAMTTKKTFIHNFLNSTLNNYLMWRLAHNYLPYLSREYWEVLDIHKKEMLGNSKANNNRVNLASINCVFIRFFIF